LVLANDGVWRADSVGGGRVLGFVDRLRKLQTLNDFARQRNWDFGEGWIEAKKGHRVRASHITGHRFLRSESLTEQGIREEGIEICKAQLFKSPYTKKRFTPPMLLVRSLADLHHAVWDKEYLTYTQRIIGFCAPSQDAGKLQDISRWMTANKGALKAYLAATSPRIFTQKSSALTKEDIVSLPYDPTGDFDLTEQEKLIASDIVEHYSELIRVGERSVAMTAPAKAGLAKFNDVFTERIIGVYKNNKLRVLDCVTWPGIVCQPYVFGNGRVDWGDAQTLRGRIDRLLREKRGGGLHIARIAKLYDGAAIFLLKPDRLRYWLPSVALRDADETLADLANQGF